MPNRLVSDQTVGERLATLEAHYLHMTNKIDNMSGDVSTMLGFMQQAKGGWKTIVAVATVGGIIGGILTKLGMTWAR